MRYHLAQSVRGALMNWTDREWRGCVRNDQGKVMSPAEVKAWLIQELYIGHEVVQFQDCDNWDWKKGCQGHKV